MTIIHQVIVNGPSYRPDKRPKNPKNPIDKPLKPAIAWREWVSPSPASKRRPVRVADLGPVWAGGYHRGMARSEKKARRLVVDGQTFLWSLGHSHRVLDGGHYEDCCETVVIRLFRARGRLRIVFRQGPDRLVPDGYMMPSGAVSTADGDLNLHEPGTTRALLDAALAHGWQPDDPLAKEIDGWTLFEAAARRHRATASD